MVINSLIKWPFKAPPPKLVVVSTLLGAYLGTSIAWIYILYFEGHDPLLENALEDILIYLRLPLLSAIFSIMLFINMIYILNKLDNYKLRILNIYFLLIAILLIILYEAFIIHMHAFNFIDFEVVFNLPMLIYLSYKVIRKPNGIQATPNNRGK